MGEIIQFPTGDQKDESDQQHNKQAKLLNFPTKPEHFHRAKAFFDTIEQMLDRTKSFYEGSIFDPTADAHAFDDNFDFGSTPNSVVHYVIYSNNQARLGSLKYKLDNMIGSNNTNARVLQSEIVMTDFDNEMDYMINFQAEFINTDITNER